MKPRSHDRDGSNLADFVQSQQNNDPALFDMRWFLEDLQPELLDDLVTDINHKILELEALRRLAIDVKENGYGAE